MPSASNLAVYRRLKAIRDELGAAGDGMATMNDALRKVLGLALALASGITFGPLALLHPASGIADLVQEAHNRLIGIIGCVARAGRALRTGGIIRADYVGGLLLLESSPSKAHLLK